GGSVLPFAPASEFPVSLIGPTWPAYVLVNSILVAVFAAKVFGFIFLMFWVRATLPRMRVDRLMNFAWKYLVPLNVANVLIAAVWYELVLRPGRPFFRSWWLPDWLVGWAVTGPVVLALVWFVIWFNRRAHSAAEEMPVVGWRRRAAAAGVR